jgi:large subunit ribosomal protein L2
MKKFTKTLTTGKLKKRSGRNNRGVITVRRRGGGHKRLYRFVNFNQNYESIKLIKKEYDPYRSASIGLFLNLKTNRLSYYLLTTGLEEGDIVYSKIGPFKSGNRFKLSEIPLGFSINNIELIPGKGGQLCRAAGTHAKLVQKDPLSKVARIKLPSKEERYVSLDCFATIGLVSNNFIDRTSLKKAGNSRWLGKRPSVRGVAMNPVDHPHGGGEGKTSGGRPSVTPWGRITKGQPTRKKRKSNKLIIFRRNQF